MDKSDIRSIAAIVGGVVALSRALGLSHSAVSAWTRIPAERVLDVERITGVSRELIRPDLYSRVE
jgi:DNA-binding transcriptional regulator YdaS (Cro superfamily)